MGRRQQGGFDSRRQSSLQRSQSEQTHTPESLQELEVQGLKLLQEGQLPAAEQMLRQRLEARACSASLYCNLAAICGMTGRSEQMIELLEQALRVRLDYPEALSNLGNASGSTLERWVLLLSLVLRKSPWARFLPGFGAPKPSPGPDDGGGGSFSPSIRSSEAWDAQACSKVPSTEKCSSLSSGLTSGAPISFSKKRPITCSFSNRSLFLV
jgi:tetratricopeptide (TPR) repeat protein